MKKDIFIFVYGTLKKGYGNYKFYLENDNVEFIGTAITKQKYCLTGSAVPFMFKCNKETREFYNIPYGYVKGEVYKIDKKTLKRLDGLEGHPRFYKRKLIDVVLIDNETLEPLPEDKQLNHKVYAYFCHNPDSLTHSIVLVDKDKEIIEFNREKGLYREFYNLRWKDYLDDDIF